jgi:hypothetical protein
MALDNPEFTFPEIFCVDEHSMATVEAASSANEAEGSEGNDDSETRPETLLLYHKSKRGSAFAPWVVGMVRNAAETYFRMTVSFERLQTQDENHSDYTVWRVKKTADIVAHRPPGGLSPKDNISMFSGFNIR